MNLSELKNAAVKWVADWNSCDLERILLHYTDDIIFYSPSVVTRWGRPDGRLDGKDELRHHFQQGLDLPPEAPFELIDILEGVDSILIVYRLASGTIVADYVQPDHQLKARVVKVFAPIK